MEHPANRLANPVPDAASNTDQDILTALDRFDRRADERRPAEQGILEAVFQLPAPLRAVRRLVGPWTGCRRRQRGGHEGDPQRHHNAESLSHSHLLVAKKHSMVFLDVKYDLPYTDKLLKSLAKSEYISGNLDRPRHRATALAVGPVGRACSCGWAGCRPPHGGGWLGPRGAPGGPPPRVERGS